MTDFFSSEPSESSNTTFWLTSDGQIAAHTVVLNEAGEIYIESGEPIPSGSKPLTGSEIAKIMGKRLASDRQKFEEREAASVQRRQDEIAAYHDKVEKLKDAGISEDAIALLLPGVPAPYVAQPYRVDPGIRARLADYNIASGDIDALLAAAY